MKVLDIKKIYMQLVKQALADGVISEDESRLLAEANSRLKDYKELFDRAGEDDIITEEEKEMLQEAHGALMEKVSGIATADDEVTPEEEALLKVLSDLITKEINRSVDVKKYFTAIIKQ